MSQPEAGPEHRDSTKASEHAWPTNTRERMQANRPRRFGTMVFDPHTKSGPGSFRLDA